MQQFKNLSIRLKLPILIGSVIFLVMGIVSFILTVLLRDNSQKNMTEISRLSAVYSGLILSETINNTASAVRSYSVTLENIIASGRIDNASKREQILDEMKELVLKDNNLKNIWCVINPNAMDNLDSLYINRSGSNTAGNFCPWINEKNGLVEVNVLNNPYNSAYYTQTKSLGREIITEPYSDNIYEKSQLFSICIPIFRNNQFIGVLGTDIICNEMNELLKNLNSDSATGKLVTNKGTVAVHDDISRIGSMAENGNREIIDQLAYGKAIEGFYKTDGKEIYKIYSPVLLGKDNPAWYYAVDIPGKTIYGDSSRIAQAVIGFNLTGLVIIVLVIGLLLRSLLNGFSSLTRVIHQLSSGLLDVSINRHNNKDEMGQINNELGALVDGLNRTAGFAQEIGTGKLDAAYTPLSKDDKLGNSLLEMRSNLQQAKVQEEKHRIEEEQRNWVTTGLARFGEILRKDNDNMEVLSYNIISNMVKYLGANQGGIFIINDTDSGNRFLELKACYAYDRKKHLQKHILPGEGLVGTCYIEGETIYMTEIPQGYISITSGLGNNNPGALLISPLKVNEQVFGIMEIASFTPFEPYQLGFIEKVGESIASTISTVEINIRTNQLLSQTKLQAEEMANQEEELRQNMEEMQATQEESHRREAEIKLFLNAVTLGTYLVEFDTNRRIISINDKLLELLKLRRENVMGTSFHDFISGTHDQNGISYEDLWTRVYRGEPQSSSDSVTLSDGTVMVLNQYYAPIPDHNGDVYKVMVLATNS